MALSKITLKLGKKTIELTSKQFEELKQDMRDLDKSHHYYWHRNPWYSPWYYNQPFISGTAGVSSANFTTTTASTFATSANNSTLLVDCSEDQLVNRVGSFADKHEFNRSDALLSSDDIPSPPSFKGSVVSVS